MTNQDLIDALRAAEAVQFGEFELSHGGTSEYYVDKYLFETDPDCLELVAEAFADRLSADDKLGGVALGGVPSPPRRASPPASPTSSRESNARDYGTANLIEGRLAEGEEIVVVEDIVTTGTSLVDAVEALRDAGATVERALVVVDREEGAARTSRTPVWSWKRW